jgi:hypothetical protein
MVKNFYSQPNLISQKTFLHKIKKLNSPQLNQTHFSLQKIRSTDYQIKKIIFKNLSNLWTKKLISFDLNFCNTRAVV